MRVISFLDFERGQIYLESSVEFGAMNESLVFQIDAGFECFDRSLCRDSLLGPLFLN